MVRCLKAHTMMTAQIAFLCTILAGSLDCHYPPNGGPTWRAPAQFKVTVDGAPKYTRSRTGRFPTDDEIEDLL